MSKSIQITRWNWPVIFCSTSFMCTSSALNPTLRSSAHQLNTESTDITGRFRICILAQYLTAVSAEAEHWTRPTYNYVARLAPALYLTSLSQNLKDHGHFLSTALISRVFASYKHSSLFTSEAKKEQLAGLWSLTCLVSLNSKEPFLPWDIVYLPLDPCTCAARGRSCQTPLVCPNPQSSGRAQQQSSISQLEWV